MERKNRYQKLINNQFYDDLSDNWYLSNDHPVVLLRAENKLRNPWINKEIKNHFSHTCKVLDIGCGAGMLTNFLALENYDVTGVDLSDQSLKVAEKYDTTKKVKYLKANAYDIPLKDQSFDVICAMDVLEHIENPSKLIKEASRLLKHGGLFFFHTFTKNILSYLLVIKCVEWFIPNTPKNMHVYNLFIKPKKLKQICHNFGLTVLNLQGFQAKINLKSLKMVLKKELKDDFPFTFTSKIKTGYCGFAFK